MKQTKSNLAVFVASLCALLVLAVAPVMAESGSDGSGSGDNTSSSSDQQQTEDGDNSTTSNESENETENETENEVEVHHRVDLFRQEGEDSVKARREAEDHTKSKEERAKTCDQIQNAVNHKLSAFNNHADKYLSRLDDLFGKVKAYQADHNLTVASYDALVAAAAQKQTNATFAVDAFKSLGTTLDCSSDDPAGMLAAAKSGASEVRDALKSYRSALKDLVVALIQASDTTATTEEN